MGKDRKNRLFLFIYRGEMLIMQRRYQNYLVFQKRFWFLKLLTAILLKFPWWREQVGLHRSPVSRESFKNKYSWKEWKNVIQNHSEGCHHCAITDWFDHSMQLLLRKQVDLTNTLEQLYEICWSKKKLVKYRRNNKRYHF